ncbi:MAG: hypothetical protein AAF557_23145 [Pseudomonadota bacterium]
MTPEDMTPEQREAYELAQRRIADAKARGAKLLDLSGDVDLSQFEDEEADGDMRLTHLTLLPPEIKDMQGLRALFLVETEVSDLNDVKYLTSLETLFVNKSPVNQIEPVRELSGLKQLNVAHSRVADLSPLAGHSKLENIHFANIPACKADPELKKISRLGDFVLRTERLTAWLRERYPQDASETYEDQLPAVPQTAPQVSATLDGVFFKLAYSDITWSAGEYHLTPLGGAVAPPGQPTRIYTEALDVLRFHAGELQKMAQANKLGANDANRCTTYLNGLDAKRLNAGLQHAIARALFAEITDAIKEDRLSPGDQQIALDFKAAHLALLGDYFPAALSDDSAADTIAPADPVDPETLHEPLHKLAGVLRDQEELLSPELRDAFEQLDRIAEDQLRRAQIGAIAQSEEDERFFRRFVVRTVGFVGRLFLRIRQVILLEGMSPGDRASIAGLTLALYDKILPIWLELVKLMPHIF